VRNPAYRNTARFSGNQTTAYNTRAYGANGQRWTGRNGVNQNGGTQNGRQWTGRNGVNRNSGTQQGFDRGQVVARHSANRHPNWDRHRDHNWNGHRCHFYNNYWVIYDPWPLYPWGYGYYPYDYYYDPGYYDSSYYDSGYSDPAYSDSRYYNDSNHPSDPAVHESGSRVSDVQRALAREGYYDGAIDGVLGPGTRRALRNYQRDHNIDATGGINQPVIEALRLH